MNFTDKKFLQKWVLTGLLIVLLGWSALIQTLLLDNFDKAKQTVSRWPWVSSPHLQFARLLFETGSAFAFEELSLAQNLPLRNWENIGLTKAVIEKPENARLQIKRMEKIQAEKYPSLEVFRRLALLNLSLYQDEQAYKYLKKMEYLDPRGEPTKDLSQILRSFKN